MGLRFLKQDNLQSYSMNSWQAENLAKQHFLVALQTKWITLEKRQWFNCFTKETWGFYNQKFGTRKGSNHLVAICLFWPCLFWLGSPGGATMKLVSGGPGHNREKPRTNTSFPSFWSSGNHGLFGDGTLGLFWNMLKAGARILFHFQIALWQVQKTREPQLVHFLKHLLGHIHFTITLNRFQQHQGFFVSFPCSVKLSIPRQLISSFLRFSRPSETLHLHRFLGFLQLPGSKALSNRFIHIWRGGFHLCWEKMNGEFQQCARWDVISSSIFSISQTRMCQKHTAFVGFHGGNCQVPSLQNIFRTQGEIKEFIPWRIDPWKNSDPDNPDPQQINKSMAEIRQFQQTKRAFSIYI